MSFQYPVAELTTAENLLTLLGSFWTDFYGGKEQLLVLLRALADLQSQQLDLLAETEACLSRQTVPILRRKLWSELVLRESDLQFTGTPIRYKDTDVVFGGTADRTWQFGEYRNSRFSFAISGNLSAVPVICNRVSNASVMLTAGVDFVVDNKAGLLTFIDNPFDNPLVAIDTDNDGQRSTRLWLFRAGYDENQLYNHLGYVFKLNGPSTLNYRLALNAIGDAVTGGTGLADITRLLEATTGAVFAHADEEIEDTVTTAAGVLLITNQRAIRLPTGTAVIAANPLTKGQAVTDTAQLFELNRGEVPDWLGTLSLGEEFLPAAITGPLSFANEDEAVTVDTTADKTTIRFPIQGATDDVETFWDLVDANGSRLGSTLAELLDTRTDATSQPTAVSLPTTINPLKFMVANVLRENMCILRLRQQSGSRWLKIPWSKTFRELLPPHTSILLFVELVTVESSSLCGSTDAISYDTTYTVSLEDNGTTAIGELLRPVQVSANC